MGQLENDSDWDLLRKIKMSDPRAFESIYTKYAAMMYGCILDISKDQHLASRIFKHVFLNLKQAPTSKPEYVPFSFWLWQYTGSETVRYMNENCAAEDRVEENKAIIDYLCFNKVDREAAATVFDINNDEVALQVKKDLRF